MFDFLRTKPTSPESEAFPEQQPEEGGADSAVGMALQAALIEQAEVEPEEEPEPEPESIAGVTTIAADTTIGGSIETESPVLVLGVVGGDLTCGVLTVQSNGEVAGDVRAEGDVVVRGVVTGSIEARGKLTIASTGRVIGDVHAHAIVLDEGGELRGRCTMGAPKAAQTDPKPDESFIGKMLDDDDDDGAFSPPELAVV